MVQWPRDAVHLWCSVIDEEQDWDSMAAVLSQDEQARASRFRFLRDRLRFIARRHMLRSLLSSYLGIPLERLRFAAGPHGKPEVRPSTDRPTITFSLSHSNGLVLCAMTSGRRVGVDAELIRLFPGMSAVAEQVFSSEELEMFRALPEPSRAGTFFEVWTRKEACLKAVGVGLSSPPDGFTVLFGSARPRAVHGPFARSESPGCWSLVSLSPAPGYEAALCVEGGESSVECWRFPAAVA